jgi:hypothetical protein
MISTGGRWKNGLLDSIIVQIEFEGQKPQYVLQNKLDPTNLFASVATLPDGKTLAYNPLTTK